MEVNDAIRTRRSVRDFTGEPVEEAQLDALCEAARWAPSGLNNQPWRFMKLTDRSTIESMSALTRYRGVVAGAAALLAVFLDGDAVYDRTKDLMSAGAAIQNILLAAHAAGLGACWLGEILKSAGQVRELLSVPDGYEFVGLVALGHPREHEREGVRHPLEQLLLP